jgi:hypothetical protein
MAFITLQFRRDTAANWTSADPTLAEGELGLETDTSQFKIGDGSTAWTALTYAGIQGDTGPAGADGTDGRTILSGAVDPTTEGEDGDFYLNTATSTIFGPKAAGTWPSGVSIIGAAGVGVPVGGTTGQALIKSSNTDYATEWGTVASSPGGSDTQVQFNDGGSFGGDSAWTWNKTTNTMTLAGQAALTLQTLTDGANVAWDCSAGAKAKVTLGGNRTVDAVTNAVEGTSYTLWLIQDGTGGRTLTWTTSGAGSFDFGDDGAPTLTTAANEADVLGFEAISIGGTLKLRFVGIKKGFA